MEEGWRPVVIDIFQEVLFLSRFPLGCFQFVDELLIPVYLLAQFLVFREGRGLVERAGRLVGSKGIDIFIIIIVFALDVLSKVVLSDIMILSI